MSKTLADMSTEERANCVGMWCYIFEQLDEPPVAEGIIAGYRECDDGRTLVIIDHPHLDAGKWGHGLTGVVPRPDLPRAWQPDGQPVPGEWEEGYAYSTYDVEPPAVAEPTIEGQTTGQLCALDTDEWEAAVTVTEANQYECIGKARRWVGEWEQA